HRAVPRARRRAESVRHASLRRFVADAGGAVRGERSRSAALPGGPEWRRRSGNEESAGGSALREHKLERLGRLTVTMRRIFGETAIFLAMMLTASLLLRR